MISAQQLLLNSVPQADVSKDTQSAQNAPLDLTINTNELKKEDGQQDDPIDPNAFMMLLSQVLSNLPEPAQTNTKPGTANEAAEQSLSLDVMPGVDTTQTNTNTLVSDVEKNIIQSQGNTEQQKVDVLQKTSIPQASTQPESTKQTNLSADPNVITDPDLINDNPAVSWIDSESFQSMAVAEQISSVAKKASNEDKSLLNTVITTNTPSTTAPTDEKLQGLTSVASAVNNVTTTITSENDPFKQEMMQSLQQLSSGVLGGTTETIKRAELLTQDMPKAVDTTQTPLTATTNQPSHPSMTHAKTLEIAVPVADPQWNNKLSEHIVWLGQHDIKSAVIKLNPEELGPLEINVKVEKDMASVNIISHSAQVRDVIDQALPRLRDMMLEQGLNLSDVQVSAEQRSNQFAQSGNGDNGQQETSYGADVDDEVQLVTSVKKGPKRLVDYFA